MTEKRSLVQLEPDHNNIIFRFEGGVHVTYEILDEAGLPLPRANNFRRPPAPAPRPPRVSEAAYRGGTFFDPDNPSAEINGAYLQNSRLTCLLPGSNAKPFAMEMELCSYEGNDAPSTCMPDRAFYDLTGIDGL